MNEQADLIINKREIRNLQNSIETLIKRNEFEDKYIDFISILFHELKNPLTPILLIPKLLLKDNNLTKQQKELISEIINSGQKLNRLINDLLDISQIESNSILLNIKEVKINDLINHCAFEFNFLIKNKNQILIKNLEENVRLNIDEKRISRVIINLISNAIK